MHLKLKTRLNGINGVVFSYFQIVSRFTRKSIHSFSLKRYVGKMVLILALLLVPITTTSIPLTKYTFNPVMIVVQPEPTLEQHVERIVPKELQSLTLAIIYVESRGNPKAFRKKGNCAGILQITPIYVREVNNILSEKRYTLEDRFDPVKSLEMFTIFQQAKNPKYNIEKATWLHNKSKKYHKKVLHRMIEIQS